MEETVNTTPPPPIAPAPLKEQILRYKLFIGIGLAIILLVIVTILVFSAVKNTVKTKPIQTAPTTTQDYPALPASEITLTFATLTKDAATIKSHNLNNQTTTVLATLPSNVKKVVPLKDGRLLFINLTNDHDHGQELAIYSPSDKKITSLVKASSGFNIDDFVISANQQFLAIWEVKLKDQVLAGGASSVYSFSLANPTEGTHLIYSEDGAGDTNQHFHYPSGISDTGEIFCDTFLPNSGAGWAYGMSVSDFKGTSKTELASMKSGSYGTQPVLSPDGNFLAFAGYDGSNGPGTTVQNGFRQALITPNTLETLDLKTKTRTKFTISNQNSYPKVIWDKGGNNLIFTTLGPDTETSGIYLYNISAKSPKKLLSLSEKNKQVLSSLSDNLVILATTDPSSTTLANLGDTYAPSYTDFSIYDLTKKTATQLNIDEPLIQFIKMDIVPSSNRVLGTSNQLALSGRQLQLKTLQFAPKPSLAPTRNGQQSNPIPPAIIPSANPAVSSSPVTASPVTRCDSLNNQQCLSQIPPGRNRDNLFRVCAGMFNLAEGEQGFQTTECLLLLEDLGADVRANFFNCVNRGAIASCADSPLYLYGPSGKKVQVQINTPIFNSNLDDSGNFNLALTGNSSFKFNNQIYSSLTFDYTPSLRKIPSPQGGTVIPTRNLSLVLQDYAQKLGLSEQETKDLIGQNQNINAPYVLVSFYDEVTSKKLLPISFNPNPDSYQNIVFYLKPLSNPPEYQLAPPIFPPVTPRGRFAAVEISIFLDQ